MIKYIFAEDEPLRIKAAKDADAQTIGEALADISAKHAGRLKPEDVLNEARDPAHVLNKHFEWDDATAAHGFRLDQARSVIRIVRIADTSNQEPKRAFLSVSDDAGRSYRTASEIMSSVDLQARLLAQADKELASFEARYRSIATLCEGVRDLREKLKRQTAAKENRPVA